MLATYKNDKNNDSQSNSNITVASDLMKDKDLTQVDNESEFKLIISEVILQNKPTKLLETGTYLGEGTTRIIIESLKNANISDYKFFSIEINPNYYYKAIENLRKRNYNNDVTLLNGLSVPKSLLPTIEEIKSNTVDNIEFKNIIIDHHESERAIKYYAETNFQNSKDDLISKVLEIFSYEPDFILLDSAGHMGNIEFNYIISKIRSKCIIALDDANHLKHYKSFLQIKNDSRFKIIRKSDEKFGFVVAEFDPLAKNEQQNKNNLFDFDNKRILVVRTDSIGDTILSISMTKAIKEKYPKSLITILVQEHIAPIYNLCPYVDSIITIDKNMFYNNTEYRENFIKKFQSNSYDYSLNTIYSRDLFSDIFATASNIQYKIALLGDLSNYDIKAKEVYDLKYDLLINSIPQKAIEFKRHIDFMNAIGIDNYDATPWVWFDENTLNFAENFFRINKLDKDKVIILFAGGQHSIRDYYRYSEAINQVADISDYTVISVGSDREFDLHKGIFDTANYKYINLCGKISILEAASLIYYSKMSIGTETSFSHIACAVDKANITILGGGHFGRFLPYHSLTSIVYLPIECYYCNWNCKFEQSYCIKEIDPTIITQAINDVISGKYGIVYKQTYSDNKQIKVDTEIQFNQVQGTLEKNYINIKSNIDAEIEDINKENVANVIKVSALVSIYKSERFINGLLEDLVNQTIFQKGELEIILIDSNSPENEFQYIEPYLQQYPKQIIYHRTAERETLYKAWNRAITISKGVYLTNANTDDRHRKDALEILANCLDTYKEYDLVYPDLLITTKENDTFENTQTLLRYEFPDYNLGSYLSNSNFGAQPMWRKSVHNTIGYFNDSYKIGGDYEFFIRLAKEFKPIHLRETLGLFLQGNDALTNSKNITDILKETRETLKTHRRTIDLKQVYPTFEPKNNDASEILAVLWDYGVTNMLSPYSDFEISLSCFNKCLELGKRTTKYNIIQDIYNNNLGIIQISIGNIEQGLELWNRSKDYILIQNNIRIFNNLDTIATPIKFQASLLSHPVLDNARLAVSLYLDENRNIKKSLPTVQNFWDVVFGNGGVEISEQELINAKSLKARSPKSQGYLKSYHLIVDDNSNFKSKEYLTSFSRCFWERDYQNKQTVLIKTPNAVGDAFAITMVVNNLKLYFPHLNIIVACSNNEKVIYKNNPQINRVIKNNSYDTDILELDNPEMEIIDYNLLISTLPEYYNCISYLDIFGNIAGIKIKDKSYKYYMTENEKTPFHSISDGFQSIIGIHLTTEKDWTRSYPHPNELALELLKSFPNSLIINFGQTLLELQDIRLMDATSLSLREQIALASFVNKFITIDSAFFHVGHNLFNTETYVLCGPTNPNLIGNPLKQFYVIQDLDSDCLSCYWRNGKSTHCFKYLKPKQIINQIINNRTISNYYSGENVVDLSIDNYEKFISNYFRNNKDGNLLTINNKANNLPNFASSWNGIYINNLNDTK
ncbi:MAG TPA: glycosyltransferase [Candidatus Kapabacteria bacterium]|nr:glycosyltransferase [Candidatus Kapabacteria bacterium]